MKNFNTQRTLSLGTLAVMSATILGGAFTSPVEAKSSTWKKVAIGSGVVTGYGLLKGNRKVALIGGLATAGSYYKYRQEKKKEARRYGRSARRYRTARTYRSTRSYRTYR